MAADELARYRAAGGVTIVDQTTIGLHPDLPALRRASHASGVRIVAGTGIYWHRFRPDWVETACPRRSWPSASWRTSKRAPERSASGRASSARSPRGIEASTRSRRRVFRAAARAGVADRRGHRDPRHLHAHRPRPAGRARGRRRGPAGAWSSAMPTPAPTPPTTRPCWHAARGWPSTRSARPTRPATTGVRTAWPPWPMPATWAACSSPRTCASGRR